MTEKLLETGARLRREISQDNYETPGGISRKDAYKLLAFAVLVFILGWIWHDYLGFRLPSAEVWEFAQHLVETLKLAGAMSLGVFIARRKKP